jgi:hypothetical protein
MLDAAPPYRFMNSDNFCTCSSIQRRRVNRRKKIGSRTEEKKDKK